MKAYRFFSFVVVALAVALSGCSKPSGGGGCTSNCSVSAPTIGSFTASPTSIVSGSSATLSWAVTGATSASIDNSVGSVTPVTSGSVSVKPTATTTYTLSAANSGGSVTAQATVTVTQPVSVSVSCAPTSVPQGETSQCAATVQNATNNAVTWSASAGTISSAGVLSVPIATSIGTQITITATSVADTTKFGTTQVTVTARQIVLSPYGKEQDELLSPDTWPYFTSDSIYFDDVSASGIQTGDILTVIDLFSGSTGSRAVNATDITNGYVGWGWSSYCYSGCSVSGAVVITSYAPHYIKLQITSADGAIKSNVLWVPITTDQNVMSFSKDGSLIYFAPGYPFAVQEYAVADGTLKGTTMGENNLSIAVDSSTGDLLTNQSTETGSGSTEYVTSVVSNSANGNKLTISSSTSDELIAVAAVNGVGYAADAASGGLDQIGLGTMSVNFTNNDAVGGRTWALDTATVNGTPMVASYAAQGTMIRLYNQNLNLISSIALSGVTPETSAKYGLHLTGGWPLKLFASGKAALLSVYDQKLYVAKLDSTNTLTLVGNPISLTGNAIGLAKDETHQAIIVWTANLANGTATITSYDLGTLAGTNIASASTIPAGFLVSSILVSSDGTKLYVGGLQGSVPTLLILKNQ